MEKKILALKYFLTTEKRHVKETKKAHINRATIILSERCRYTFSQAKQFINTRAQERDYTNSTINKWYQTFHLLNSFFHWNWQERFTQLLEYPTPKELLSKDEMLGFYKLETIPKYNLIIRLLISTGARPSEILTLRRREIDLERELITLDPKKVKTRYGRCLIIRPFLIEELKTFFAENNIKPNDYIFYYNDKSKPISVRSLEKEFDKRLKILGIAKRITPYCMRHEYCTRMASKVNSLILKELVGHRRIETTEGYFHCNPYLLKEAVTEDILFHDSPEFLSHQEKVDRVNKWLFELGRMPGVNQLMLLEAQALIVKSFEGNNQIKNQGYG